MGFHFAKENDQEKSSNYFSLASNQKVSLLMHFGVYPCNFVCDCNFTRRYQPILLGLKYFVLCCRIETTLIGCRVVKKFLCLQLCHGGNEYHYIFAWKVISDRCTFY